MFIKYYSDKTIKKRFLEYDREIHTTITDISLTRPELANIIANTLHYWDNKRLDLYCYCIMPNHVHTVFRAFEKDENGDILYLVDIMRSIKNYSAKKCNEVIKRTGQFWQHESYDRLVRDRRELYYTIRYVLNNPVKAGYCNEWREWKWTYLNPEFSEFGEP
jgi:REP element-mobilizing transposase RayT